MSWAFEMETLILGWYVMVQTGSVLLLTTFGSLQLLGTLAAPMFGVLGDRLGGRTLLCVMRAICAALAAVVMVLGLTGMLTPLWVFIVAALTGIVRPNDLVMRHALIGETIPPDGVMGAVGMSRANADSATPTSSSRSSTWPASRSRSVCRGGPRCRIRPRRRAGWGRSAPRAGASSRTGSSTC